MFTSKKGKQMKNQVQKGFTLIELMIVVAIIGILAAVALPAYSNYTARAYAGEALGVAQGYKTAVAEYHSMNGAYPSTLAAINKATIATEVIDSIALTDGTGVLTINMAAVGGFATTDTIVLTPTFTTDAGYDWDCTSDAADDEQLPPDCVGQ